MARCAQGETYPGDPPAYSLGTAGPLTPAEDQGEHPAATLWLVDPETRRGWALYRVEREKPKAPGQQPVGFRR